jgi:pantothenate kinase
LYSFDNFSEFNIGDSNNVDLLVGDIYGEDTEKYKKLGLSSTIIASRLEVAASFSNEKQFCQSGYQWWKDC